MPIHFEDLDVVSEVRGLKSALIVPCNLCPGVTIAVRENRPFLRLLRSLLKSAPLEEYLEELRTRLEGVGVRTSLFRSRLYHHWFMCMWTPGKRRKLQEEARKHEAVVVLGCDSATRTVRDVVDESECKVVEGMRVSGIMNAKLSFSFPADIRFEGCGICPISQYRDQTKGEGGHELSQAGLETSF